MTTSKAKTIKKCNGQMRRLYAYAANDSTLSLFLRSLHAFLALVLSNHAKLRVVQFRQWQLWGKQNPKIHTPAREIWRRHDARGAPKKFSVLPSCCVFLKFRAHTCVFRPAHNRHRHRSLKSCLLSPLSRSLEQASRN